MTATTPLTLEKDARFRVMAECAPVLIWVSGPDKLCTWFNRRWLEFVGRSMEQELGNGWVENVHADDVDRCLSIYTTAFEARKPFTMEYRLRRHDGVWRWVEDQGAPFFDHHHDHDGQDARQQQQQQQEEQQHQEQEAQEQEQEQEQEQFGGYVGSCVDITDRREAGRALRETEARYQTLAESLPHLVWTCRPDGYCDYLSLQWVEYTGRPAEEQLGSGWAELLHPDDRERVQAAWGAATTRGDYFDVEFRIRNGAGTYRWFKTRAVPLRDPATGEIVKWFGSNTDVEDYKQSERRLKTQLERVNLLDQITRAIGRRQDLRSILQVVVRSLEDHLPIDFCCVCSHEPGEKIITVMCVGVKSGASRSSSLCPSKRASRSTRTVSLDVSRAPSSFMNRTFAS